MGSKQRTQRVGNPTLGTKQRNEGGLRVIVSCETWRTGRRGGMFMRGRRSRAESQMITGSPRKAPLFGADRLHGQRLTQRFTALWFCHSPTHRLSPRSCCIDKVISIRLSLLILLLLIPLTESLPSIPLPCYNTHPTNMQAAQQSWGSCSLPHQMPEHSLKD